MVGFADSGLPPDESSGACAPSVESVCGGVVVPDFAGGLLGAVPGCERFGFCTYELLDASGRLMENVEPLARLRRGRGLPRVVLLAFELCEELTKQPAF